MFACSLYIKAGHADTDLLPWVTKETEQCEAQI